MRNVTLLSLVLFALLSTAFAGNPGSLKAGFTLGDPDIRSVNAMAFGPE